MENTWRSHPCPPPLAALPLHGTPSGEPSVVAFYHVTAQNRSADDTLLTAPSTPDSYTSPFGAQDYGTTGSSGCNLAMFSRDLVVSSPAVEDGN